MLCLSVAVLVITTGTHTLKSCVGHLQLVQALQEGPLSFQSLSLRIGHMLAKSKFA